MDDPMGSGLRFRVKRAARQIADQHQQMEAALRRVEDSLEKGSADDVREHFQSYRGALDAHFSLEDGVFFPALHGLHPDCASELEALAAEHRVFLERLVILRETLEGRGMSAFGHALRRLAAELMAHESREERLVRSVSRLAGADG